MATTYATTISVATGQPVGGTLNPNYCSFAQAFTPAGLFTDCNPWPMYGVGAVVVLIIISMMMKK